MTDHDTEYFLRKRVKQIEIIIFVIVLKFQRICLERLTAVLYSKPVKIIIGGPGQGF